MRTLSLALVVAVAGSSDVTAQLPCYAENDVDAFKDNTSTGGPNLLVGIRFVATQSQVIGRIEVFTGEKTGPNTVGIWSHDATMGQPLASLGSGSWNMSSTNSWQGADLTTPVSLNAGAVYWLVWGPQNGAQSSLTPDQPFPGPVYRGSFDGGVSWNGPWQNNTTHWKFRLYCACDGFYQSYGTSCPPAGAPTLTGAGCATPGSVATIEIDSGPAGAAATLFLGSGNGTAPINPTCLLQTLPLLPVIAMFNLSPSGDVVLFGPLPQTTPTIDFYLQAFVADPAAPSGFTSTRPLQMHVQ